jgi:hypothetical protein
MALATVRWARSLVADIGVDEALVVVGSDGPGMLTVFAWLTTTAQR